MINSVFRLCTRRFGRPCNWRNFSNKAQKSLDCKVHPWGAALKSFENALDRRPVIMNAFIGGFFMCAGDLLQQIYFNDFVKWREVVTFTTIGVLCGPLAMVWYRNLDRWLPGTRNGTILKKLILDEIVWGPFFAATVFYLLPLVETRNHQVALAELKQKFFPAWLGSAGFWFVFQSINFKFLPTQYRVVYLMAVSFVFDTVIAIYRYQY